MQQNQSGGGALWSSPHFHILSLTSISLLDRLEGEFRQHFSVAFAQQDYRSALLGWGCGGGDLEIQKEFNSKS